MEIYRVLEIKIYLIIFMVEYKNSIEDIEFLIRFWNLKMGFTKYKYFISSIGVISGIYYSITLKTPLYIVTNIIIIMTLVVFYWMKNTEENDLKIRKEMSKL